jgi:hypothetical protein
MIDSMPNIDKIQIIVIDSMPSIDTIQIIVIDSMPSIDKIQIIVIDLIVLYYLVSRAFFLFFFLTSAHSLTIHVNAILASCYTSGSLSVLCSFLNKRQQVYMHEHIIRIVMKCIS